MNAQRANKAVNAPKKKRTRKPSKHSSKEPKVRILFVASEGLPFSKTGGLADVVEALPKALVAQGHEVAVVLPLYRGTPAKKIVVKSLTVPMGTSLRFPAIADGGRPNGVQYFFIDDPEYFD